MAVPTWVGAGTKSTRGTAGTTSTVAPPAGHATGDLLVIVAASFVSSGTATIATPSGWTLLADSTDWTTDTRFRSYLFWKLATSGSEPSPTLTSSVSAFCDAQMYAFRGVHATTPINASGGFGAVVTVTNVPTPAVTTLTSDTLIVYVGTDVSSPSWNTPPAGATEQLEGVQNIVKFIVATEPKATAGTEAADNYVRASTTSRARIATFAIAPAGAAPVADFTATPLSGTAPLSVAFTDTSANTPTSWSWDFGDSGTSSSQNPTHSYTTSGTFTVSLTATNATGSDSETKTGYITVGEAISYVQPSWVAGGGTDIW